MTRTPRQELDAVTHALNVHIQKGGQASRIIAELLAVPLLADVIEDNGDMRVFSVVLPGDDTAPHTTLCFTAAYSR